MPSRQRWLLDGSLFLVGSLFRLAQVSELFKPARDSPRAPVCLCNSSLPSPLDTLEYPPAFSKILRKSPPRTSAMPLGKPEAGCGFRYRGDTTRLRRVIARAGNGSLSELNVVILGGSMAAGRMKSPYGGNTPPLPDCYRDCPGSFILANGTERLDVYGVNRDCRACAFGARFGWWLRRAYPGVRVNVHNCAVGGSNTRALLLDFLGGTLQRVPNADLFIVHYVDNDAAMLDDSESARDRLSAAYELLVRTLLERQERPAVIEVQHGLAKITSKISPFFNESFEFWPHSWVARHYALPIPLTRLTVRFSTDERHPPWPWHQLIAEQLAFMWRVTECDPAPPLSEGENSTVEASASALPLPIKELATERAELEFCTRPLTSMDAGEIFARINKKMDRTTLGVGVSGTSEWSLSSDRDAQGQPRGRPGWWADTNTSAKISFVVQVNEAHPIVTIAYLTSFERMGRARVFVDGDREGAMVIDANETSGRYSLVRVREVCFDGGASRRRPGSLPVPPCSERGLRRPRDVCASAVRAIAQGGGRGRLAGLAGKRVSGGAEARSTGESAAIARACDGAGTPRARRRSARFGSLKQVDGGGIGGGAREPPRSVEMGEFPQSADCVG